jgi:V/A-type H+-transporting ATPase subunit I
MLLAVLGWFTLLKNARQMVVLVFLLGAMTAVMGIIKSGSVFGIPLTVDSDVPLFRFLSGFILIPDDQDYVFNAFNVALMFGVLQILIGVIASIINKTIYYSFKEAIPQIGKLFIVVGVLVLFLSRMQSVEALKPFDAAAEILLYTGIGLVLLFNDMTKPVLKRIGGGVLPLFFIFTGILGDILSYVRLFALGVASSVLGLVVNRIGMQIMDESWWSILLAVVFLIFGHSLNLALAALGAFVHPLRLTFVEFYNNAGFSGGGKAYEPLKKELKT